MDRPRSKFGKVTITQRSTLEILTDESSLTWKDFDQLDAETRELVNEFGEVEVKEAVRFAQNIEPDAIRRRVLFTRKIRRRDMLVG